MNKHKHGPTRTFTPAEIALYAKYQGQRTGIKPRECKLEAPCWVLDGPPALFAWKCKTCLGVPGGR